MNLPGSLFVGDLVVLLPDRVHDRRIQQLLDRLAVAMLPASHRKILYCRMSCVTISFCAIGSLLMAEPGVLASLTTADIFGVVGDAHPVERRLDLDVVAGGCLIGCSLGVL